MGFISSVKFFARRRKWAFSSLKHIPRLAQVAASMLLHRNYSSSFPLFLKIDLSPNCNIRCATCIHADKPGDGGLLDKQQFHASQKMPLEQYKKLIDKARGKCLSVVLHYLGDPFMYPDLDEAAHYAFEAGMRVHVGSNFSYPFTDERIESLLHSGITDLTVCVDGLSQELYQRTRVGGKIEHVLNNLERLCKKRKELNLKRIHIEVQYIRFDHNRHQEAEARKKLLEIGVDQFTAFDGYTINYVNVDPNSPYYKPQSPHPRKIFGMPPHCHWPYTSMVIRYDGEVIPCCFYRLASQYADGIKPMSLGNVFDKDGNVENIEKMWNGQEYQNLRKQVFDGSIVSREDYCYGCSFLFDVDVERVYVTDVDNGGLTILNKT